MKKYGNFDVELLTWCAIRNIVEKVSPEIAAFIDRISPDKRYKLYRLRYSYGSKIADKSGLKIPMLDGSSLNLSHAEMPREICEDLSYSSLPMGIILNNSVEVYGDVGGRTVILDVFPAGVPLGLLEVLEPKRSYCIRNVWNISAGLRSAFMLPSISDSVSHNKLMKIIGCEAIKPSSNSDHFSLFKKISRSLQTGWHVDILRLSF